MESVTTASTPTVLATVESAAAGSQSEAQSTSTAFVEGQEMYSVTDMQLLHHYSTVVYATLSAVFEQREAWRTSVVKVALQYKFFLQGILAFSALHMAHVTPAQARSYLFIATTHQDAALAEFRRLLGDQVTSETSRPLFLFSCFLAMYAFALPGVEGVFYHAHSSGGSLDGFLDCVQLVRGTKELLVPWFDVLAKGELGVLLGPTWNGNPVDEMSMPESLPLAQLYTACDIRPDTARANPYSSAIHDLHTAFRCTAEPNGSSIIAIALTWPIVVPKDYLELLKEQEPKAMVILAHYAVLLHEQRSCWIFQHWGRCLIERIAAKLGQGWESALAWPKQIVGLA